MKSGKKSLAKINYGDVQISKDDLDPKYTKERISIWVDEDVLNYFRNRAFLEGKSYQSLINEVLRLASKQPSTPSVKTRPPK